MIAYILIFIAGLVLGLFIGVALTSSEESSEEEEAIQPEVYYAQSDPQSPLMRMRSGKMPIPETKTEEKDNFK